MQVESELLLGASRHSLVELSVPVWLAFGADVLCGVMAVAAGVILVVLCALWLVAKNVGFALAACVPDQAQSKHFSKKTQ